MLKSIALFVLAALCEIGGAYLVWQWARAGRTLMLALIGAAVLFVYAFVQTNQSFNFGRAFAGYGGIFITVALLWGWWVDGHAPDHWDWLGVAICLIGVVVILWAPRQ